MKKLLVIVAILFLTGCIHITLNLKGNNNSLTFTIDDPDQVETISTIDGGAI